MARNDIVTDENAHSNSTMLIFTQICIFFSDLEQINFEELKSTGMSEYIVNEIHTNVLKCQCLETSINSQYLIQVAIKQNAMTVCVSTDTYKLFVYCPITSITHQKVIEKRTSFDPYEIIDLIFHFNFFDCHRELVYDIIAILRDRVIRLQILSTIYKMKLHMCEPGHANIMIDCNKCSALNLESLTHFTLRIYEFFHEISISPKLKTAIQGISSKELSPSKREFPSHDKLVKNDSLYGNINTLDYVTFDSVYSLHSLTEHTDQDNFSEIPMAQAQDISKNPHPFPYDQDEKSTNSNIIEDSLDNTELKSDRPLDTRVGSLINSSPKNQQHECFVSKVQSKTNLISKNDVNTAPLSVENLARTDDTQSRMCGDFDSRTLHADNDKASTIFRKNPDCGNPSAPEMTKVSLNSLEISNAECIAQKNHLILEALTSNAPSHEDLEYNNPRFDMFEPFILYFHQYYEQFSLICHFLGTLDTHKENLLETFKIFDSELITDTKSSSDAFFISLSSRFHRFLSFARSIFNYNFVIKDSQSNESILFDNGPKKPWNYEIKLDSIIFLVDTIRINWLNCLNNISLLSSSLWDDLHPINFIIIFNGLNTQNDHLVQPLLSHQLFSRNNVQTIVCVFLGLPIPVTIERKFQLELHLSPILNNRRDFTYFFPLRAFLLQNNVRYLRLHVKIKQYTSDCDDQFPNLFSQFNTGPTISTSLNASSKEQNLTNENCSELQTDASQSSHFHHEERLDHKKGHQCTIEQSFNRLHIQSIPKEQEFECSNRDQSSGFPVLHVKCLGIDIFGMPFPFYVCGLGEFHANSRITKNSTLLSLENCETSMKLQIHDRYEVFQVTNSFRIDHSLELCHFPRILLLSFCNIALIISDKFKLVVQPFNQRISYSFDALSFNLFNFINILHRIKQVNVTHSHIYCIMMPFFIQPEISSFWPPLNPENRPDISESSNPPYNYKLFKADHPEQSAKSLGEQDSQRLLGEPEMPKKDTMELTLIQSLTLIDNNLTVNHSFISIVDEDLSSFALLSNQYLQLYTSINFILCIINLKVPLSCAHLLSSLSLEHCIGKFHILDLFTLQCKGEEKVYFKSVSGEYHLLIDNTDNLIILQQDLLKVRKTSDLDNQ